LHEVYVSLFDELDDNLRDVFDSIELNSISRLYKEVVINGLLVLKVKNSLKMNDGIIFLVIAVRVTKPGIPYILFILSNNLNPSFTDKIFLKIMKRWK